jgi:hypothetical protein
MLALAAGATYAATGGLLLGPASTAKTRAFKGYYDGHKGAFLAPTFRTGAGDRVEGQLLGGNRTGEGRSRAVLRSRHRLQRAAANCT